MLAERRGIAVEENGKIKVGGRLELMKPRLQSGARSFEKDITTGGCERIGKARHSRMLERLGTGDPNYGRTKSRPKRDGR